MKWIVFNLFFSDPKYVFPDAGSRIQIRNHSADPNTEGKHKHNLNEYSIFFSMLFNE